MKYDVQDAQSTIRATVSNALAEALVLGIDEVAQRTTPLTQKQQVALAAMSIMSYDKAIEACELLALAFPRATEPGGEMMNDFKWRMQERIDAGLSPEAAYEETRDADAGASDDRPVNTDPNWAGEYRLPTKGRPAPQFDPRIDYPERYENKE